MICPVCGKEIADGSAVCPICGVALTAPQNPAPAATGAPTAAPQYAAPQNAAPQFAAPQYAAPQYAAPQNPAVMPKNVKEFIKQMSHIPEYKKMGTEISVCGILLYICAGLTMVVGLLNGSAAVIIDVVILVGLGLWIQLGYSRVAAVIAMVYSIISMILATITTGRLSGYLIVIATVCAVIYTFKAAKAFKQYKESAAAVPPQQQFPQQ